MTKLSQNFVDFLDQLPGTNFRTFIGVLSSVLFVVVVLVGLILRRITAADVPVIASVGSFILVQMGLDVKQFIEKRRTFTHPPTGAGLPPAPDQPAAAETPL